MSAGLLANLIDYLQTRISLLGLEAREARSQILARIVCGIAAGLFLALAWVALVVAGIGWVSRHFLWPWPLVTAGAALLHGLSALILLQAARRRFAEPPFRDSLNELEKDRQWLKRHRQ